MNKLIVTLFAAIFAIGCASSSDLIKAQQERDEAKRRSAEVIAQYEAKRAEERQQIASGQVDPDRIIRERDIRPNGTVAGSLPAVTPPAAPAPVPPSAPVAAPPAPAPTVVASAPALMPQAVSAVAPLMVLPGMPMASRGPQPFTGYLDGSFPVNPNNCGKMCWRVINKGGDFLSFAIDGIPLRITNGVRDFKGPADVRKVTGRNDPGEIWYLRPALGRYHPEILFDTSLSVTDPNAARDGRRVRKLQIFCHRFDHAIQRFVQTDVTDRDHRFPHRNDPVGWKDEIHGC